MTKHALIVTYTMPEPAVVGVFFRALRLAEELHRRGWRITIGNFGQVPEDPKVTRASRIARILEVGCPTIPTHRFDIATEAGVAGIAAFFESLAADIIVFGEGPFGNMQQAYDAALSMPLPFVLLEQYYSEWLLKEELRASRVLLYGLQSFWKRPQSLSAPYVIIPPFVANLAPASALPVGGAMREKHWLTILGFEKRVLQSGIELASRLGDPSVAIITLSHDPEYARQLAMRSGLDAGCLATLPLQADDVLFSLIARSRCVVLANGFMQVMETLCLACPAIAIDRGLGMADWMLDDCFRPYVSIGEDADTQLRRARAWLRQSPFSPELRAALGQERDGARVCAEQLEQVWAEHRARNASASP